MSRIFLSHSSQNSFEAIALRDWLKAEGWDDVFLDLDAERGIAAGERWERALHAAATRCEAVIFLISADWLASGWCLREYAVARGLNKKLFGALIDFTKTIADVPEELRGTWQLVNLVGGQDAQLFPIQPPGAHEERHVAFSRDGLRRLKLGLEKAGLDPKFFAWPPAGEPGRAPYRGLLPLEAEDAGVFFGREAPIVEATDRLRGLAAGAPPRLLAILGASGAGKSSFLRAGLLPRIGRDDAHFIALRPIRPGRAALTGADGLLGALEAAFPERTRAELRAVMGAGEPALRPLFRGLVAAASARLLADAQGTSSAPAIVLVVDQAEELFRAEGAPEGDALLELLNALTRADDPAVIAAFAIRSDSYDALERAKPLQGLPQGALPLLPMPKGAYKEVIEGPARRLNEAGGKLAIEPRLTQRLLEDIEHGGGSDALPLLAFTLEQLYLEYHRAGALRLADYEAFGGLKGAIDAAVGRAFVRADADPRIPRDRGQREKLLRRGLIPWLAGVDPDTKSARRNIARKSDIPAEAAPLVDLLIEERLLSTDSKTERDPETGHETRVATIEPAHEALLRQWGLLEGWLEEDFGLLAALEGVKRAARDWDANARDEAWLAHQGQRLSDALTLDDRPDIAAKFDWIDRAYLAQCRAREEAARAEAEQRRKERDEEQARRLADAQALALVNRRIARRTGAGLVVAMLLAAAAAGFGVYAQRERTLAVEQGQRALAREAEARDDQTAALAALSTVALATNPTRATKLALAAWPRNARDPTPKLDVTVAAASAAVVDLRERLTLRDARGPVSQAVFSPKGDRILTVASETAELWDAASGRRLAVLDAQDPITSAVFSTDGKLIATSTAASLGDVPILGGDTWLGTARLWDASTGAEKTVLGGQGVFDVAFSPHGSRLVAAGEDKTAVVWDVATGRQIAVLRGHDGSVNAAVFSPDGSRIVTTSQDDTARIWDGATYKVVAVLRGDTDQIWTAAFSPNGQRVVTASRDGSARVWDAATGRQLLIVRHNENIWSAAFSPDGSRIVTASSDKTARVWDAATGRQIAVLPHEDIVASAAFSPDGRSVVTASSDKSARVWDAATGQLLFALLGHDGAVNAAVFSPDGRRIVTASEDGSARVWDAPTARLVLSAGGRPVDSAVFSPDGRTVATGGEDGLIRLWDAATGRQRAVLRGHQGAVRGLAFSPDGSRLASASADKTARIWDAATGRLIAVLSGHAGPLNSVAFSADGRRVVTASDDKTARVWDAAAGKQIGVIAGHQGEVFCASFSPDGTRIVTGSFDGTLRLWDATAFRQIAAVNESFTIFWTAVFSRDGNRILAASTAPLGGGQARIWDAGLSRLVEALRGSTASVRAAAFSPDGTRVVTASDEDKTARLWDVATGRQILVLRGHAQGVLSAAFSPGGKRVVTASSDGAARIWDVGVIPKGDLFHIACAWLVDHDLTDIARDYGLKALAPICRVDPPPPDRLPQ